MLAGGRDRERGREGERSPILKHSLVFPPKICVNNLFPLPLCPYWRDSTCYSMNMETSTLNPTRRYAGCASFALALNQSQARLFHHTTAESDGFISPIAGSVSDRPHLWIHDESALLFPIFKYRFPLSLWNPFVTLSPLCLNLQSYS